MKNASLLLTFLLTLGAVALPAESADAQQARGTVKRSKTTVKRHHSTHSRHEHRGDRHGHYDRHHSHRHYRSGVQVHVGWPYYYSRYYHHRPHHTVHRHTVVYETTPEVVVIEQDHGFTMPALECPIRTREERTGLEQWCSTGRGTKHGAYRRWYADGVLAAEGYYEYDVKHGLWTEYHTNGALREEGAYKDGARVGTWVTWGSDGQELVAVEY